MKSIDWYDEIFLNEVDVSKVVIDKLEKLTKITNYIDRVYKVTKIMEKVTNNKIL